MTKEYRLTLEVYRLEGAAGVKCSVHVRENGAEWESVPPTSVEDDADSSNEAWLVSTVLGRLDKMHGAQESRNLSADLRDLFYSVFLDKLANHIEEHGAEGTLARYVNDAGLLKTLADASEKELLLKLGGDNTEPAIMENLKKLLRMTASKVSRESIAKAVMRKSNVKSARTGVAEGEG